MSIHNFETDSWGNDLNGVPCGLYMYYFGSDLPNYEDTLKVLGNLTGVVSTVYVPFHNVGNMGLWKIPYDVERFGKVSSVKPQLNFNPFIYRAIDCDYSIELGTVNLYKDRGKNTGPGCGRSWRNEGKLYNYPFSWLEIHDGFNPPLVIRPELAKNYSKLKARLSLSDKSSYGIYLENYKGDENGFVEAMVSGDGLELPSTDNQYASWVASSKNQTRQNVLNSVLETKMNIAHNNTMLKIDQFQNIGNGVAGMLGGALSLNLGGVLSSGFNMGVNMVRLNEQNKMSNEVQTFNKEVAINNALAMSKDSKSTPNTLVSQGANAYYGLKNNVNKSVKVLYYSLHEKELEKIGDYFAMYGYKQNRLMNPDLRNRKYYNYIKMIQCNIKNTGDIPVNHLAELKAIYERGTTIWHVDRTDFCGVANYSLDNFEV